MRSSFILLVVFAAVLPVCAAKVMSVDFGSRFFKVALLEPMKPFEIVVNINSKRKTQSVISFERDERLFGNDAERIQAKKPHLSAAHPQSFLGRTAEHPELRDILSDSLQPKFVTNSHGSLSFVFEEDGSSPSTFSPEELTAMLLGYARRFTELVSESKITDCVITIPSFASHSERLALLQAADLAGLKVLRLIEENTAAALQYGIDRIFENQTHFMLVYNIGGESTQASMFKYTAYRKVGHPKPVGQIESVAKAWDLELGGAAFDEAVAEILRNEFKRQYPNVDLTNNKRALAKLRSNARKVKEILSANELYPLTIESLTPDIDFRCKIDRKAFLKAVDPLLERAAQPLLSVLRQANVSMERLDAIELIGGSVRIPAIQDRLSETIAGKVLGMHLNGDEAPALGAAFHAANVSRSFRTRPLGLVETTPFAVGVTVENAPENVQLRETAEWSKRATIFKPYSRFHRKTKISFHHDRDLRVRVFYKQPPEDSVLPQLPPGAATTLAEYDVTGIQAFAHGDYAHLGTPRVTLHFLLDENGLVSLYRAEATLNETKVELVTPSPSPTASSTATASATTDSTAEATDTEVEGSEDDKAEEPGDDGSDEETTNGDSAEDTESGASEEEAGKKREAVEDAASGSASPTPVERKRRLLHREPLTITVDYTNVAVRPLNASEMAASRRRLESLDRADEEKREMAAQKNAMESYIFSSREKMYDETIESVSTEEQREAVTQALESAEDWLYDEGETADLTAHLAKQREMEELVEPILFRASEIHDRPSAASRLRATAKNVTEAVEKWEKERPQVKESERTELLEKVEEALTWLEEKEEAQTKVAAHEAPVLTSSDINKKRDSFVRLYRTLRTRPKPKPSPSPSSSSSPSDSDAGTKPKSTTSAETDADGSATPAAQSESGEESAPAESDGSGDSTGTGSTGGSEGSSEEDMGAEL